MTEINPSLKINNGNELKINIYNKYTITALQIFKFVIISVCEINNINDITAFDLLEY